MLSVLITWNCNNNPFQNFRRKINHYTLSSEGEFKIGPRTLKCYFKKKEKKRKSASLRSLVVVDVTKSKKSAISYEITVSIRMTMETYKKSFHIMTFNGIGLRTPATIGRYNIAWPKVPTFIKILWRFQL